MKLIKTIVILCIANLLIGQDKFELSSFCNSVSYEKDISLASSIRTANSSKYNFELENGTLVAEYVFTDWMMNSYTNQENEIIRKFNYSIPLDSIETIDVKINKYKTTCDTCYITSANLNFVSANNLSVIKGISDGYASKISNLVIPINQLRDTSKFEQFKHFLNSQSNNKSDIKPTCEMDSIMFEEGYPIWVGVKSENLETPILLNDTPIRDLNQFDELKVLIEELKLNSLTLNLVINQNNKIENLTIFEYEIGKVYKEKLQAMDIKQRKLMIKTLGVISEEDKNRIDNLIKKQDWKSGKCNGDRVQSILWIEFTKTI